MTTTAQVKKQTKKGTTLKTVKVGQAVWFKSDTEQMGIISRIETRQGWDGRPTTKLILKNESGFRGGYIGGMRLTEVDASDCWL